MSEARSRPRVCRDGEVPPQAEAVAAVGNFDGIHLGHQRLIRTAVEEARTHRRSSAVLTFEPHPRDFFHPDQPAFRLTPEPIKLKILGALGVETVFIRRFDSVLASMSAEDFVSLMARTLNVSEVIVGSSFHFGRHREGTPDLLRSMAEAAGMRARIEEAVQKDGAAVSSSRVRSALMAGDIGLANRLLGYRWLVCGEVIHGEKRGRLLGFPTANVALDPGCRLAHGIYGVRVATPAGSIHEGVASFGRRPTFDNGAPLLETFLFDFAGDLYGQAIEIELLGWIRGEERFGSVEDLVRQMRQDEAAAREIARRDDGLATFIG